MFAATAVCLLPSTACGGLASFGVADPRLDAGAGRADETGSTEGADAAGGSGRSSSGGGSSGGAGTSSGDGSSPTNLDGSASPPWSPVLHGCGVRQLPPPPGGPEVTVCSGVTLSNVHVAASDGGPISAGTTAMLSLDVISTRDDINTSPCLGLSSDNPAVAFGESSPILYALSPQIAPTTFTAPVTFGPGIAPGTSVHLAAWLVWHTSGWPPDASEPTCAAGATQWDLTLN
jgi:hypothetical protein